MEDIFDAIIISNIHLGSDICQSKVLDILLQDIIFERIKTKELILNGDIFDSWDFRILKKNHWKILSDLRKLSDKIKITWVEGNHDGPAEIVSHLIGIDVFEDYILESGYKKIFITHGHIFDSFIEDHPIITEIACFLYFFTTKDRSIIYNCIKE